MAGALRLLLLALVLMVVVVVAGGFGVLREKSESVREKTEAVLGARAESALQGAAQLSPVEFAQLKLGTRQAALRARVGEPESRTATEVEGLRLECWYYGIVGATGSYQFCFSNGALATKWRYGR